MIDLTNCKEIVNTFGGSEKKMAVLYNDKKYMVKFPDPVREKNNDLSYINNQLSPLLSDELMKTALEDPTELKSIEFNIHSVYSYKGERVLYHSIFKNPPVGLKAAIARIVPRIDMNKIYKIVNNVEDMSDTRKKYLNKALTLRYDKILLPALKKQRNYSR